MSERDAFLSAIVAEPDDDSARLVFADWLEENGEPESASFTRLAEPVVFDLPAGRPRPPIGHVLADLAGAGVSVAVFRLGFPERVDVSGRDWVAGGSAIRARYPLRDVVLTSWPPYFLRDRGAWQDAAAAGYWPDPHAVQTALELRWVGVRFSLPASPIPTSPILDVETDRTTPADLRVFQQAVGRANANPFLGHAPGVLLLTQTQGCVSQRGRRYVVCRFAFPLSDAGAHHDRPRQDFAPLFAAAG